MRQPHTSMAIYDDLKEKIMRGAILSGEYLVESHLAQQYRASRTPIRQALKQLREEGLVTTVPNKGTYVCFLSAEDIIEAYQVAEALEGMAVFLLASPPRRNISVQKKINAEMKACLARQDIARWCHLDEEFHEGIVGACENSLLKRLYGSLQANMRRVRTFYTAGWHDKDGSCHEHDEMLARIEQGDARGARLMAQNHYRKVINRASLVLQSAEVTDFPHIPLDTVE